MELIDSLKAGALRRLQLRPEHLKLGASLAFNFISKVPGVVSVFVILPLVSVALGSTLYGELLSALALGSAFTLPCGGINAVGRRLLAGAVGAKDPKRQADAFITTTTLMGTVMGISALIMLAISARTWSQPSLLLVSLLPIAGMFANVFDNLRAGFNEHYVTAVWQLLFQVLIYGGIYLAAFPPGNVPVAGLVMQAPFLLASLATLALLLHQRPYLKAGHVSGLKAMLAPAAGVMLADGALAFALNLSVYYLSAADAAPMSAWVGTFTRLFQSFLSPVMLIMFPVSTYISIHWREYSAARKRQLHWGFLAMGVLYGAVVGLGMTYGGQLYIDRMFHLEMKGDRWDVLALSLFMGAVIAQKAYTMLLYSVSEARFVSYGTAAVTGFAALVAALSRLELPPMRAVDVFFAITGAALPLLLCVGSLRYRRAVR